MLDNDLSKLGFEDKEAPVYLALLELGEANKIDIARKSGLKRTTVYHTLDSLLAKGMAITIKRRGRDHYRAEQPEKIRQIIHEKSQLIEKILPQLLSITNFLKKKPLVKYYEGRSGFDEIYKDILNYPDQEVLGWIPPDYFDTIPTDFFYKDFIPERKKRKIWVRLLAPQSENMQRLLSDQDLNNLRRTKLVPAQDFNLKVLIYLYGREKITILSLKENFALVIESRDIYESQKSIFNLVWNILPEK